MALDERDFFNNKNETRNDKLTCPRCKRVNELPDALGRSHAKRTASCLAPTSATARCSPSCVTT